MSVCIDTASAVGRATDCLVSPLTILLIPQVTGGRTGCAGVAHTVNSATDSMWWVLGYMSSRATSLSRQPSSVSRLASRANEAGSQET